jgi:hypothetical protein
MSNEFIFGVDLSKKIETNDVRKALIDCFFQAHRDVLAEMKKFAEFESEKQFEELSYSSIEALVKNMFKEIGADYEKLKKEDFIKVVDKLVSMATNFRTKDIIEKHKSLILTLIDKLD